MKSRRGGSSCPNLFPPLHLHLHKGYGRQLLEAHPVNVEDLRCLLCHYLHEKHREAWATEEQGKSLHAAA